MAEYIDKISDAIITTNLDYTILSWNKAAEKIYGWKGEEIIGKNILDTIRIEYPDNEPSEILRKFEDEGKWKGYVTQYTKEGQKLDIYSSVTLIKDKNEENKKIVAINQNLTEQRRIERQLRESEKIFRKISEQSRIGIQILQEGKLIYVNNKAAQLTGYKPEEVQHWPFKKAMRYIHPEDLKEVKDKFKKRLEGQNSDLSYEFRVVDKDDNVKWIESLSKKINIKQKPATLILLIDITKRKEAAKKLRKSEQKYRMIVENANEGIWMIDEKGFTTFVNEKMGEILGYDKEELMTRHLFDFMEEKSMKIAKKYMNRRHMGIREQHEFTFKKKDGQDVYTILNTSPIFDDEGKYKGALALISDITEKKIAEKKLRESENKYRNAYNRTKFYEKIFSHDINNIFQVVESSAELVSKFNPDLKNDGEFNYLINLIEKQIKQGKNMVENIQKISELQEKDIRLEEIDILTILNKSVDYIKNIYDERDLEILLDSELEECSILGNNLLFEVFKNIMVNSIRYNNNSKIEITVKVNEENHGKKPYLKIQFIDNGIGIEDKRKKAIFKDSYRKKGTKGMGLGLSLVKTIIDKLNGKIWVEDRVQGDYSKGSNFIIMIPA